MNVRLANKVLLSVAALAAALSALAACDLGLAPFEPQVDAGPTVPFDSGSVFVPVEAGPADAGTDASDASTGPKRVFVTSIRISANFGGQAGADNVCQTAASQARLGSRFVAWVSETNKKAIDHIADVGPWYLVDRRTLVFPSKAAIVQLPRTAISMQENGESLLPILNSSSVWTGTTFLGEITIGAANQTSCLDWTSKNDNDRGMTGSALSNDQGWTQSQPQFARCDETNRLYCFEQ